MIPEIDGDRAVLLFEERRIRDELVKLGALADVSGIRGTSEANVAIAATRKVGAEIRKRVRANTPRGATGNLKRATKGHLRRGKRTTGIWYFAGWYRNPSNPVRFQQRVAMEFGLPGSRDVQPARTARRIVLNSKNEVIGARGEGFAREFNRQMLKRIEELTIKANARLNDRRGGSLRGF